MRSASGLQQHVLLWKATAAWFLLASCAAGLAQESAKPEKPPILFQKAYVLKEEISELDGEYKPLLREEFDQKLKAIRSREIARDAPLDARIVHASYSARLVDSVLVDGTAELTVIHSVGEPAVVPVGTCGLAMGELVWRTHGTEESSAETANGPSAAKMGLDDAGRMIALVETSGDLQFQWSLRGHRKTPDELAFELQFPASPVNHLELEIPLGFEPSVEKGIVSEIAGEADDEAYRRWLIELGGNTSTDLRIVPSDDEEEVQRLVFLRQQTTYQLSQTGVEVLVDLHLDVRNESLSQLTLVLDESLQLLGGSSADTPLNWTESLSDEGRKVVVELPEPILGINRTIQFRAVAPITLAERWQLPSVAVEGAIWLEGGAALEVPRPLVLEHLTVDDGRQTKVSQSGPDQGESVQIQYFKPEAIAHVIVRPHEGEIIVHQGTTVKVGQESMDAIHVADFDSTGSPRFVLEMKTSNTWTVDLIESSPPDLIEEWEISGRVIQLRLREALTPDRRLRVIVHGHRRRIDTDVGLDGQNLRFCVFSGVKIARSLVAVGAESPYQVQLEGDAELIRMGASELTDQEGEQLTWLAGGVAYVDGPAADDLTIKLSTDPPKYAADIHIQSDVGATETTHTFRVRCVPESSSIDRLHVHFSEPSVEDLRWLLKGDDDAAPVARRLTLEEQQERTRGGETWEIVLPSQQDSSFELTASWTKPFNGESTIPLVSLTGAASQVGSVMIRSPETVPISIRQANLKPIPPAPPDAGRYTTIRGAFRYEPSRVSQSRVSVVRLAPDAQAQPAWIWLCQLVSRLSDDGQATHEVVYRIENRGAVQLDLIPPVDCEIAEASVNGIEVPLPADVSADPNLVIPLPRGVRFPTVVIRLVTQAGPLRSVCRVSVPWPQTNLSVFRREWVAWLPPGFDRLGDDAAQANVGWHRRLFGPLLRSEDQIPFNPLSEHHWQSLGMEMNSRKERLLGQAETFLRDLAQQTHASKDSTDQAPRLTWGELLASWETSGQQPGQSPRPAVWVDQHGLAQLGITAQTPVDQPPAVAPSFEASQTPANQGIDRGVNLLERAGLAVISFNDGLLLTTADRSRRHVQSADGALHGSIAAAVGTDMSSHFLPSGMDLRIVPLNAWTDHPPLPQECWSTIPRPSISGVVGDGWTVHVMPISNRRMLEGDGNQVTHMRIHQPRAIQALAWAAFLATLGLVWWITRRWLLLGLPLTTFAAIAALFAPEGLIPVFSGSFLGTLLAACLATAFSRNRRRGRCRVESDSQSQASSILLETAGMGLVAAIAWTSIPCASAQEAAAPKPPVPAGIQRVLFPIDEARQPTGDYVYVPPALYTALHRQSSADGLTERKWMICAADYRAAMRWDVANDELAVTELVAKYEVEVPQRQTNVILPVQQGQVSLLSNRAQLNGQPASVSWVPGGLSVKVAQAGMCTLELAFRPRIKRTEDRAEFQIDIPPVPCSELRIELPDQALGVEFPTALGSVLEKDQTGLQVVMLGPTDRLCVRWPIDPSASSLSSALSVDQLMWLKVRPGSVVLDAKLKFTTLSGTISQVQLLADPRLTILGADQPIAGSHASTHGGVQTIWLDMEPPFGKAVAFDVSFVLTGTWGVGNVHIPRLEAVADRTNRRWLGVSVADGLEFERPKPATDDSPPTIGDSPSDAEFSEAWGQAEEVPQVVIQVPDGQADWMLPTWPRKPVVMAAQRLAVSLGRYKAEFQLDADIQIADGNRFQYRILAPRLVRITSVSVVENDTERAAGWYHDGAGVIVRLDAPVAQTHRLQLRGEIPIRGNGGNVRLPRITLTDVTLTTDHVDLYRRSQVQVKLNNKAGLADVAGARLGIRREGWGRLVAAFERPAGLPKPATIQARLKANEPRPRAHLVITLDRQDGVWLAEADCHFRVKDGIIDAIRLEVPPEWKEPFELDPVTEMEIVEVPDQNRRQIVIRPPEAVEDFRIRVRGTLAASAGERVRAPDIIPLDVAHADRYLVAPTGVQGQQIAWETSGLREEPLPGGYEPDLESYVSYYCVGEPFQATIKDEEPESGMASVHLADIHVNCSDDGSILGVATFDLEPAGLSDCVLELPAGYGLVHVTVGNLPAQPERIKEDRWQFRLGPRQLPQQVQVLFTGTLQPAQWQQRTAVVQAPRLDGIPVDQTLWTVRGPSTGDIKLVPDDTRHDPLSHELIRLDKMTSLVEAASDVMVDSDSVDISHWHLPWARRLIASHCRAAQWHATKSGVKENDELTACEAKQRDTATRLGVESPSESECSQVTEPADVWRTAFGHPVPTRRCAVAGTRETIEFRHSVNVKNIGAERWATITILLGITLVCLVVLPNPSLEYCFRRCPQLLGIPLGFAWWLWFAPSLLGLIILLLAGLGSVGPLLRAAKLW